MNIIWISIIALASGLLIDKRIVPSLKIRKFKKPFPEAIRVGWIAVAGFLKKFCFTTALAYLGIWVLFKVLNMATALGGGNPNVIESFITFYESIQNLFDDINSSRMLR